MFQVSTFMSDENFIVSTFFQDDVKISTPTLLFAETFYAVAFFSAFHVLEEDYVSSTTPECALGKDSGH